MGMRRGSGRFGICSALWGWVFTGMLAVLGVGGSAARGDAFSAYGLDRVFALPAGASSFDVLGDGRVIALVNAEVFAETAVGSGAYISLGTLAGADVSPGSFATGFLRVSPDGTQIAVGNNGGASFNNFNVGVFNIADLSGGWYAANNFDAAWIDDRHVALSAGEFGQPGVVTALDTFSPFASPVNPELVNNIGGSSGGVAFDAVGNLYTGNAFDGPGASDTGWIKAFPNAAWQGALSGGSAVDFEAAGKLVVDVLSAGALGFDAAGNLHVGGSDLFGSGEGDFAALVRAGEVLDALSGGGPAVVADPGQVRQFDPDVGNDFNFYDMNFNAVTGELYVREGETVYSFVVPEPATLGLLALGAMALAWSPRRLGISA